VKTAVHHDAQLIGDSLCNHCAVVAVADWLAGGRLEYCAYDGELYRVGESWLVDDCTQCTCMERRQVLCSVTLCDITSPDQCRANAACCPQCRSQSPLSLAFVDLRPRLYRRG